MHISNYYFLKRAFWQGLCLFLAVLWGQTAQATHIRAGDIVARSLNNPLQWEFTLVIFTNSNPPNVLQDEATLYFGDGSFQTQTWVPGGYTEVEPGTHRNEYRFTHTYGAPGYYAVAFNAENRNAGILNMNASVQTSFYIQTDIFINPLLGPNNTPKLAVPPLDKAVQGQIFEHNPQAYDIDGDSLSYRLIVPRMSLAGANTAPIPSPVANYTSPADPIHQGQIFGGGAPATFTLDNQIGLITWNTPGRIGEYNIAFVIEEWRLIQPGQPRLKMSETTRDMQILVEEDPNKPPKVKVPKDLCVIPGTIIQDTITVSDPDGHAVLLELFSPLPFSQIPGTPVPGADITLTELNDTTYTFRWEAPQCADIRGQAYQFVFKATDIPGDPLVPLTDFATWSIKVVGPKPTNVVAEPVGQTIQLNWDTYSCQNGDYIKIYRRENPYPFIPDSCELGVPAYTGYVKIAEVPITATTYTDDTNLKDCVNYSYILSVDFPLPAAGESYASNEAFTELKQVRPTLTKVSVETTDSINGSIRVHWQPPLELNPGTDNSFRMKVQRAEALSGPFAEVFMSPVFISTTPDTTFVDSGLNTIGKTYYYRVDLETSNFGGPFTLVNSSDTASSVFLTGDGASGNQTINLTWTYNTPWSNANNQHYIYRDIDGVFTLIDSVLGTGATGAYADAGTFNNEPLEEKETYCYYVVTQGDYACDTLPQNLLNNSQRICVFLEDKTAPCTPILTLEPVNCENFDLQPPYTNRLRWQLQNTDCDSADIAYYTVFYTPSTGQVLDSITLSTQQFFDHQNLMSLAGCYQVSVTDSSGNESPRSNLACNDNCVFFELPNIITPNGDNLNDRFQPSPKSRFVKSFAVTIFNRWGEEVYRNSKPDTFWNGTSESGKRVPHGIYYYQAEVEFFTLDPGNAKQTFKGWLEVIE